MNPQQLYAKDKHGNFKEQDIWFCGKCKKMTIPYGHIESNPKERAEACCKPKLCSCGKEIKNIFSGTICQDCDNKERSKKLWEKRNNAKVVSLDDYKLDYVVTSGGSFVELDNLFNESIDELENYEYFYAAKKDNWSGPDWDGFLEDYMADNYSDEYGCDTVDLDGTEELALAHAAFEKKNSSKFQYVEDPTMVILAKDIIDYIKKTEKEFKNDRQSNQNTGNRGSAEYHNS